MNMKSNQTKQKKADVNKICGGGRRVVRPLVQVDGALDGGRRILGALPDRRGVGEGLGKTTGREQGGQKKGDNASGSHNDR